MRGEIISQGLTEGVLQIHALVARVPTQNDTILPGEESGEIERFQLHVNALIEDLNATVDQLELSLRPAEAEILRTHVQIVRDPELHRRVESAIVENRLAVETAVERAFSEFIHMFRQSGSALLAERSSDLKDLSRRLQQRLALAGQTSLSSIQAEGSGVVVATRELYPSFVLEAQAKGIKGFVIEYGTHFSHAAILARSFGLPVLRVSSLTDTRLQSGVHVLLDAINGEILFNPDATEYGRRLRGRRTSPEKRPGYPLSTGLARLWLNIVDPEQLDGADWTDIEGVGLYRTEMHFMQERWRWPDEETQVRLYRRAFELGRDRVVTIRTLDVGADKPLPYLSFGPQDNPALGLRAHRLYRFHPEIAVAQIRAILRAAEGDHQLRLLFPMIESLEEWFFVQALVDEATSSLRADRLPFQTNFDKGILIETPSAVWDFNRLVKVADFASIGTNDLVQYIFAVDRNAANVAVTYRPEHPIILQIIKALAETARLAGKPLSICGEIAGEVRFVPLLIGLGVTDLSVSVPRVRDVLHALAELQRSECRGLAQKCLAAETANDVDKLLGLRDSPFPDLSLFFNAREEAVDPVCKMVVHTDGNPHTITRHGKQYFFCSPQCVDRFRNMKA